MNVYRIIQEGVNNALKYADASEIKVNFNQIDDNYEISISDNGKGFDISSAEMGNGLANIKKRARELNGNAQIESVKGVGTKIIVSFSRA